MLSFVSFSFVLSLLAVLTVLLSDSNADVSVLPIPASALSIFGSKCRNENIKTTLSDSKIVSSPFELYKASSSVVVGILNNHELRYNIEEIESYMQSYLDNVFYSKQSKELVIIYEVKLEEVELDVQASISRINSVFNQLLDGFSSRSDYDMKDNAKLTIIPINRSASKENVSQSLEKIQSLLEQYKNASTSASAGARAAAGGVSSQQIEIENLISKDDDSIINSPLQYEEIEMQFVLDFSTALNEVSNSSVVPLSGDKADKFSAASIITESTLNVALETALQKNYEKYFQFYENSQTAIGYSYSVLLLSYRIRMRMNQLLHAIYRKSIDHMKATSIELFELNSKKTPTDSKFRQRLNKKANILIESFQSNCDALTHAMRVMAKKTTAGDGLYNAQLYQKLKSTFLYQNSYNSGGHTTGGSSSSSNDKFTYAYDLKTLKAQLSTMCEEKLCEGIIQGRHNPFIRSHPFPPLTLKFHYLFDPRSMVYSMSYDKLYDAHKEGMTPHRAAPLLIPGTAFIPFNPNDLPVAKENKAWWKVLQDFFNNEL